MCLDSATCPGLTSTTYRKRVCKSSTLNGDCFFLFNCLKSVNVQSGIPLLVGEHQQKGRLWILLITLTIDKSITPRENVYLGMIHVWRAQSSLSAITMIEFMLVKQSLCRIISCFELLTFPRNYLLVVCWRTLEPHTSEHKAKIKLYFKLLKIASETLRFKSGWKDLNDD